MLPHLNGIVARQQTKIYQRVKELCKFCKVEWIALVRVLLVDHFRLYRKKSQGFKKLSLLQ
jgi:hypothetical protein